MRRPASGPAMAAVGAAHWPPPALEPRDANARESDQCVR